MGERAQIYIRYNIDYTTKSLYSPRPENYKGLIARYFQWCYGERMVSRARYLVANLKNYLEFPYNFADKWQIEKLIHLCNVNFDMKDILMSSDIIGEWKDEYQDHNFNEIVFKDQDNNDGQLFIDVTCKGIRYCFTRFPGDYEPMSAEEYMKWNCEYDGRPNWHKPGQYMSKETIGYTEENIKKLDEAATVMTAEELKDFIDGDYSYLTGEVEREVEHE